jgi:hypothetical protein
MSEEKVINYRNVHKSDHLGVVDLEEAAENGTRPIVTIKRVEQYAGKNKALVAGRKINCNIAYFVEPIKPLVINATNGAILKGFADSVDINKWAGLVIELYADKSVQMKGQTVGGIRIKKTQPQIALPTLSKDHEQWDMAVGRVRDGMTFEEINKFFLVSASVYEELQNV